MKPSFEKLVPTSGQSYRCFDRSALDSPTKWHRHPEVELTYIPQGSGSRIVGDHIGSYGDHDLVLIGSFLPHTWASDEYRGERYDRHTAIVLQFHPEFLGPDFFACGEMSEVAILLQRSSRGLFFPANIAATIGQQMTRLVTSSGAARFIGLLSILSELADSGVGQPLASEQLPYFSTSGASDQAESRIQQVCDHISQHLSDPELSHRDLAELANMNASAFSRFFKQSTGRTVSAYINELRIGLACRLLVDRSDAILSICHQAGFGNLSNFNRRFRQLRGMTPSEYRTGFRTSV
ncbi:helix-turn-helix domain-containing protein [Planctomycetes bacterium K23_9]|uniref:HTH-type transcriptional activator Btr n=1 Tax=Stieleria marina TaxID=1930275 RepID=A0A517NVJ6_9BACT|nr:HTH-type transcriptional activator Btr [Planctomycetes bacterium K23_9]